MIPLARDDDVDEVRGALSVARSLMGTGNDYEAVRWLHKAASGAAEAGATERALELFEAAASLTDALSSRPTEIEPPRARPVIEDEITMESPSAHTVPFGYAAAAPFTAKAVEHTASSQRVADGIAAPPGSGGRTAASSQRGGGTLAAMPAVAAMLRVTVVGREEGGELRVAPVPPGQAAPSGAIVALLVPQSAEDADRIMDLLAPLPK
jgi:hypothetical protein